MKLSTHQIQSIMKDFGNRLNDYDILFLLHDELDFDILLPLIHRMKWQNRNAEGDLQDGLCAGINADMLKDIFGQFPRLMVWLFINKEEKLKEYLKLFTSFSDVSHLLALDYSGSVKINEHIRAAMATLYEGQTEIPKTDGIVYRRGSMSQSQEAFLSRVVGTIIPTQFASSANSGILNGDGGFRCNDPETILSEIEKLIRTPLILASEPTKKIFGDYSYNLEDAAPRVTPIGKVHIDCTVENLMGHNPNLPAKYLRRISEAKGCVEVWLDVDKKEYLVVVGTETTAYCQAYTKRAVRNVVHAQAPASIKRYFEEAFRRRLREKSSGISAAKFRVDGIRSYNRGSDAQTMDYEVLHFPATIIESIR